MIYACAAQTGREFAVEAELRDLGGWVCAPRQVSPLRPPGESKWFATERPLWPGYVFADLDGAAFFEARNIRYLHKTKLQFTVAEAAKLTASLEQVDAVNARVRREIEAGNVKSEWTEGERAEITEGLFRERLCHFATVIERSGAPGYKLRVYVEGMELPVDVDPWAVKRA